MKPFELREPSDGASPLLVEVPHAGLGLDAPSMAWTVAPVRCLARDADLYVDELFADSCEQGATLISANISRYVVDLNRGEADFDGRAVAGGDSSFKPRGVIWRLSSDGMPVLRERLSRGEYERRIEKIWRPYHDKVTSLLREKKEQFGFAVMLCAHSMPTPQRRGSRRYTMHDPDIVPGTRGRSSSDDHYIDIVEQRTKARGWSIQHDVPYRGGYSTGHYGKPGKDRASGTHVIQLEIARRLYMDERHLVPNEGFANVKDFATELVATLVDSAQQVYRNKSAT